ncbi:hypothetical protein WJX74_001905 [Apatococcus lobatus]|uniref:Polymerase nucleotidyl transferase domain-containing protein n=1 Tax=Apatococcus lobatus TaxID=904363 RepID=A0AAW1S621_9CHLO
MAHKSPHQPQNQTLESSTQGASCEQYASSLDERVEQLLGQIKPGYLSEQRRHSVATYACTAISNCFAPENEIAACVFGSVPLKTYLPDGDIDIAVFQRHGSLSKDTWATRLLRYLEKEQKYRSDFQVRDVQVINAEVKLLKCLINNIVVDISFNTVGGLCTVAFLEQVDRKIGQSHFFKRSIILIKAWCYYESRLLGAPHGLISTYALETMVLYIFNAYHASLSTPLQVLRKFLSVFSDFDWDRQCLCLSGPVPLSSLPEHLTEEPAGNLKEPLFLPGDFLDHMHRRYNPAGSTEPSKAPPAPRSFPPKHLNIMDPLLPTNNLGRSVNQASAKRIRLAFRNGASTLEGILAKDDDDGLQALDDFFRITWTAHRESQASMPVAAPNPFAGMPAVSQAHVPLTQQHLMWQQQQLLLQLMQQHSLQQQQQQARVQAQAKAQASRTSPQDYPHPQPAKPHSNANSTQSHPTRTHSQPDIAQYMYPPHLNGLDGLQRLQVPPPRGPRSESSLVQGIHDKPVLAEELPLGMAADTSRQGLDLEGKSAAADPRGSGGARSAVVEHSLQNESLQLQLSTLQLPQHPYIQLPQNGSWQIPRVAYRGPQSMGGSPWSSAHPSPHGAPSEPGSARSYGLGGTPHSGSDFGFSPTWTSPEPPPPGTFQQPAAGGMDGPPPPPPPKPKPASTSQTPPATPTAAPSTAVGHSSAAQSPSQSVRSTASTPTSHPLPVVTIPPSAAKQRNNESSGVSAMPVTGHSKVVSPRADLPKLPPPPPLRVGRPPSMASKASSATSPGRSTQEPFSPPEPLPDVSSSCSSSPDDAASLGAQSGTSRDAASRASAATAVDPGKSAASAAAPQTSPHLASKGSHPPAAAPPSVSHPELEAARSDVSQAPAQPDAAGLQNGVGAAPLHPAALQALLGQQGSVGAPRDLHRRARTPPAGGLNGWALDARHAAGQQSAPLLLPGMGLAMTSVPLAPHGYSMLPRDELAGDLAGMDNQLIWARSCQGSQGPLRNTHPNGLPRGPHPRAAVAPPAGPIPGTSFPSQQFGLQLQRSFQGPPTHLHNPLLSQISQAPLPQNLQMNGGPAFPDDLQAQLQSSQVQSESGLQRRGSQGMASVSWAGAHLSGPNQPSGMPSHIWQQHQQQQRVGGNPLWEEQTGLGGMRYGQGHGPARDGGLRPGGTKSRPPTRSTSAGALHEAAMLGSRAGSPHGRQLLPGHASVSAQASPSQPKQSNGHGSWLQPAPQPPPIPSFTPNPLSVPPVRTSLSHPDLDPTHFANPTNLLFGGIVPTQLGNAAQGQEQAPGGGSAGPGSQLLPGMTPGHQQIQQQQQQQPGSRQGQTRSQMSQAQEQPQPKGGTQPGMNRMLGWTGPPRPPSLPPQLAVPEQLDEDWRLHSPDLLFGESAARSIQADKAASQEAASSQQRQQLPQQPSNAGQDPGMLMTKRLGPKRGRSHDSLRAIPIHMQEPGGKGFGQAGAPQGSGPSSTHSGLQDGVLPAAPGSRPAGSGPSFTYAEDDFPSLAAAKGPASKGPSGRPSKGPTSLYPGRAGGGSHSGVSRPASEPDLSSRS